MRTLRLRSKLLVSRQPWTTVSQHHWHHIWLEPLAKHTMSQKKVTKACRIIGVLFLAWIPYPSAGAVTAVTASEPTPTGPVRVDCGEMFSYYNYFRVSNYTADHNTSQLAFNLENEMPNYRSRCSGLKTRSGDILNMKCENQTIPTTFSVVFHKNSESDFYDTLEIRQEFTCVHPYPPE